MMHSRYRLTPFIPLLTASASLRKPAPIAKVLSKFSFSDFLQNCEASVQYGVEMIAASVPGDHGREKTNEEIIIPKPKKNAMGTGNIRSNAQRFRP